MTFKNLISLSIDEEKLSPLAGNLNDAMRNAIQRRKQQMEESAAEELVELLSAVESRKEAHRKDIRVLRSKMDGHKECLDQIDRAFSYGSETGNFIPVLVLTDQVDEHYGYESLGLTREEFMVKKVVPSNWQPKAAPTEPAE